MNEEKILKKEVLNNIKETIYMFKKEENKIPFFLL